MERRTLPVFRLSSAKICNSNTVIEEGAVITARRQWGGAWLTQGLKAKWCCVREISLLWGISGSDFAQKGKWESLIDGGNFMSHGVKKKNNARKLSPTPLRPQHCARFMFKYPQSCPRKSQASKTASNPVHKRGRSIQEIILHEETLVNYDAGRLKNGRLFACIPCVIYKKALMVRLSPRAVNKRRRQQFRRWAKIATLTQKYRLFTGGLFSPNLSHAE